MVFTNKDLYKNSYSLGEVSKFLSMHPKTLQKKDREGVIQFERTPTNRRFLTREKLIKLLEENNLFFDDSKLMKHDIIYARVSNHKQKQSGELEQQVEVILKQNHNLQNPIILKEVGSGLNEQRLKLQQLLKMVLNNEVNKIYTTYKDRLTIFGFEYIETICNHHNVEIVVMQSEQVNKSVEQELKENIKNLLATLNKELSNNE